MVNKNEALIVEENFFDILLNKKNNLEIQLEILRFINSRSDNQFLAIDLSTDIFKDKTTLIYFEILEDGSKRIYYSRQMD